MKNNKILLCGAMLALAACSSADKYTIQGTWEDGAGQTIYLKTGDDPKQLVVIDSAVVKSDNTFALKGLAPETMTPAVLVTPEARTELLLYRSGRPIEVKIWNEMRRKLKAGETDSVDVKVQLMKLVDPDPETAVFLTGRDLESGNAFISLGGMFMLMEAQQKGLSLDSVFNVKTQMEDAFEQSMEKFLDSTGNFRSSTFFIRDFVLKTRSFTEAQRWYDSLTPAVKESAEGKMLLNDIELNSKFNVGGTPDDFTLPTPDGDSLSLYSLRGNVVLLDFWASWCAPCLAEAPNVKKIYEKYHDKGLEVLGVSLDKEGDYDKWVDAIKKHGLNWKHVSSLKGWDCPVAKQFNVTAIPRMYILDRDGKIIAQDLRGEELAKKMDEIFADAQ